MPLGGLKTAAGLVLLLLSAGTFLTDHANSISPNLHLPQQIVVKNKKHILKREKETPFFCRLGISFALDHEKPTPVKTSIGQGTEHTSHPQATTTRTHATEGFRP